MKAIDKNGVPIHIGDTIEYPNGKKDIVRFITFCANGVTLNENGVIANHCCRAPLRTIEDVLLDYVKELHSCRTDSMDHRLERVTPKYADEIREIVSGR